MVSKQRLQQKKSSNELDASIESYWLSHNNSKRKLGNHNDDEINNNSLILKVDINHIGRHF